MDSRRFGVVDTRNSRAMPSRKSTAILSRRTSIMPSPRSSIMDFRGFSVPDSRRLTIMDSRTSWRNSILTALPDAMVEPSVERMNAIVEDEDESPQEVYSIYSTGTKRLLVLVGSLACFLSPLSSNTYFPVLNTIAKDLQVSVTDIDLSITTFLIIQGIAPMMIAGFSDNAGRRPAYIICFVLYLAANFGLALQNSYPVLMVLRCLQSAGSSGLIALGSGIVGDLTTLSERGSYMGIAALGQILGPSLAPVIGGLISQYLGWKWIFWFLFIFSTAIFVPLLLCLPETCRKIVGNGSLPPPALNKSLLDCLRRPKISKLVISAPFEKQQAPTSHYRRHNSSSTDSISSIKKAAAPSPSKRHSLSFPNPLSTLAVIFDKEAGLVLSALGISMACFYAITTAAALQFRDAYGLNDLQISFVFVPLGLGGIISAFVTGKFVDWNFCRHAKRLGIPILDKKAQDVNTYNFPIEQARLEIAIPVFWIGAGATAAYGWLMNYDVHIAAPVAALFIIGLAGMAVYQALNILIVDIYPGKPATASAANNFMRCELGAVAAAVVGPLIMKIGSGWTFTILAIMSLAYSQILWLVMARGPQWRKANKEKQEMKDKATEDKAAKVQGFDIITRQPRPVIRLVKEVKVTIDEVDEKEGEWI